MNTSSKYLGGLELSGYESIYQTNSPEGMTAYDIGALLHPEAFLVENNERIIHSQSEICQDCGYYFTSISKLFKDDTWECPICLRSNALKRKYKFNNDSICDCYDILEPLAITDAQNNFGQINCFQKRIVIALDSSLIEEEGNECLVEHLLQVFRNLPLNTLVFLLFFDECIRIPRLSGLKRGAPVCIDVFNADLLFATTPLISRGLHGVTSETLLNSVGEMALNAICSTILNSMNYSLSQQRTDRYCDALFSVIDASRTLLLSSGSLFIYTSRPLTFKKSKNPDEQIKSFLDLGHSMQTSVCTISVNVFAIGIRSINFLQLEEMVSGGYGVFVMASQLKDPHVLLTIQNIFKHEDDCLYKDITLQIRCSQRISVLSCAGPLIADEGDKYTKTWRIISSRSRLEDFMISFCLRLTAMENRNSNTFKLLQNPLDEKESTTISQRGTFQVVLKCVIPQKMQKLTRVWSIQLECSMAVPMKGLSVDSEQCWIIATVRSLIIQYEEKMRQLEQSADSPATISLGRSRLRFYICGVLDKLLTKIVTFWTEDGLDKILNVANGIYTLREGPLFDGPSAAPTEASLLRKFFLKSSKSLLTRFIWPRVYISYIFAPKAEKGFKNFDLVSTNNFILLPGTIVLCDFGDLIIVRKNNDPEDKTLIEGFEDQKLELFQEALSFAKQIAASRCPSTRIISLLNPNTPLDRYLFARIPPRSPMQVESLFAELKDKYNWISLGDTRDILLSFPSSEQLSFDQYISTVVPQLARRISSQKLNPNSYESIVKADLTQRMDRS